jgi:hypothetical protein
MALDYEFYEDRNLLVIIGSGCIVLKDFEDYVCDFLCHNPTIKSGFLGFGDFRKIETNEISMKAIRDFVRLDETMNRPQPSKFAFVVSGDADFGTVRQFAAHVQVENKEVMPFRNINDAKTWLGIQDMDID